MRIRTANRRRRRALAREVYRQGFEFHRERCARLEASGNLDRVRDSGFIRRLRKKSRLEVVKWLRYVTHASDGGPMHYHLLDLKPVKDNY